MKTDNRTQIKKIAKPFKKILVVTEYYASELGGAEKSIKSFVDEAFPGAEKHVVSMDGTKPPQTTKIGDVKITNIAVDENKTFRFMKIARIAQWLKTHSLPYDKYDAVVAQSLIAPFVVLQAKQTKTFTFYLLRDEHNVNEFKNYYITPALRFAKNVHASIQAPFINMYKKANLEALCRADAIITNSFYMKTRANALASKTKNKTLVWYPILPGKTKAKKSKNGNYVLFLGGHNPMKGYNIVEQIAKAMPDTSFTIVTKAVKEEQKKDNITFLPWGQDVEKLMANAGCVIMPSRWNEAFGRTVIEAHNAGTPCITSNKGGLPEANIEKNIVDDVNSIDEWIKKINQAMNKKQKNKN